MNIKSISFENYKAFIEKQTIQIKPITILIGKNSSGKSSIAKLFTLFENSLSGEIEEPLLVSNHGVSLGADFRDLVSKRDASPVSFGIEYQNGMSLDVSIFKKDPTQYNLDIQKWRFNHLSLTLTTENYYIDSENKKYDCAFKGFIPTKILLDEYECTKELHLDILKIDVDYIGPFRILPERIFYLSGEINYKNTGIKGENAYAMLGSSMRIGSDLYKKVSEWYEKKFDGWKLIVKDNFPYVEVVLTKDNNEVNIVDVGQGMNQALPLVVRANTSNRQNSMIILEQPELHLHPAAHGDLAELFVQSAMDNQQTYIIETHSENFLLRLRNLVIKNPYGFTKDDVIIYWIENAEIEGQELREITIDDEGELSDWPEGVFNENLKEISQMRASIKEKRNDNRI